jgi:hypothetical protein
MSFALIFVKRIVGHCLKLSYPCLALSETATRSVLACVHCGDGEQSNGGEEWHAGNRP